MSGWVQAMDEALVVANLGVAEKSDSYDDAKKKLYALIAWHVSVTIDPRVNGGWKLVPVDPTQEMIEEGAKAIVSWDEGCEWPKSWGEDAERHRRDCRKAYNAMLSATHNP